MIKKASMAFAIFCFANSAVAQWEVTAGYSYHDLDRLSLGLGAAVLGAGYSFPINDKLSITPMLRVGFGVKDDDYLWTVGSTENGQPVQYEGTAKVELSKYHSLQIRADFELTNKAYAFVAPSYTMIESKRTFDPQSIGFDFPPDTNRDDMEGVGLGAGVGLKFSELISAELSYETTDYSNSIDGDVLSVRMRFSF